MTLSGMKQPSMYLLHQCSQSSSSKSIITFVVEVVVESTTGAILWQHHSNPHVLSQFCKAFCHHLKINVSLSSKYHLQLKGQVEYYTRKSKCSPDHIVQLTPAVYSGLEGLRSRAAFLGFS